MGTLILNTKVVRDVECIDDGQTVKFLLPARYLSYEKGLISDLKREYKGSLFEKILINYHCIYHFDDKAYKCCLPVSIITKRGKAIITFTYMDKDKPTPEYLQEFTDKFAAAQRLKQRALNTFWFK